MLGGLWTPSCALLASRCTLRAYIQNLLGGIEGEEPGRIGGGSATPLGVSLSLSLYWLLLLGGGAALLGGGASLSKKGLSLAVPMMGRGRGFLLGSGVASPAVVLVVLVVVVLVVGWLNGVVLDGLGANGLVVAEWRTNDLAGGVLMVVE